ncbi:hypothetical protein AAFF_G00284670 [Aldrovandia affinis]|uniref:Uncharacterized protein n=1 Tax=Aldrovandia affinis TaxID=143900 RepID=A0AAD7X1W0_9TELE|nr:hypothetical protein AAFF_G00284670 [Aldrovandia affinis]
MKVRVRQQSPFRSCSPLTYMLSRGHIPVHLGTVRTRRQHGEYHRLVQDLRLDGERFQRYFRLDRAQFDELLTRVGPRITRLDTNWRSPISAAERLAICLRYLATGDSYRSIAYS